MEIPEQYEAKPKARGFISLKYRIEIEKERKRIVNMIQFFPTTA